MRADFVAISPALADNHLVALGAPEARGEMRRQVGVALLISAGTHSSVQDILLDCSAVHNMECKNIAYFLTNRIKYRLPLLHSLIMSAS